MSAARRAAAPPYRAGSPAPWGAGGRGVGETRAQRRARGPAAPGRGENDRRRATARRPQAPEARP